MKKSTQRARISSNPLPNVVNSFDLRLQHIEYRPLPELKTYNRHARRHSQKQIAKLAACIAEFGFLTPVLADETGTVVAGHGRVEAARTLGLSQIPVIPITHLSKEQIRAYRIADNRLAELATWDIDALTMEIRDILTVNEVPIELLGWNTAEIDVMLEAADAGDGQSADAADIIPALPSVPTTRIGDIWLMGEHRLLCGSSLDPSAWQLLMAGRTGAMSFTDPPYNVPIAGHVSGLGAARHAAFAMASGEMSDTEFVAFNAGWIKQVVDVLMDGAVLSVCMDWRHVWELISAVRDLGLEMINMCVWNKTNGGMGSLYRSKHELVLILKKGRAPHINNVELGRHGRYRTNVWDYAGANSFSATRMDDLTSHPTVKPVALVADAIRDVTHREQIVVDAFMGSGTTILAAERTGRIACGIEIEPGYVDVAIRRWEDLTGRSALLEETGEPFAKVLARRLGDPGDNEIDPSTPPVTA